MSESELDTYLILTAVMVNLMGQFWSWHDVKNTIIKAALFTVSYWAVYLIAIRYGIA